MLMVGIVFNENFSVSPQISIDDLQEIKNLGFDTIICNRPDGEDFGQTNFDEIEKAATLLGLKTIFQPIIGGTLNLNSALEFKKNLENSSKTFAYCRSGTRCISLMALVEREAGKNIQDIYNHCIKLGYDVSGVLANIK